MAQLAQYPVRGLVFEASSSLEALAELVGKACQRLAAANVPHNLFIADCGARIFLLPNAFAERKVGSPPAAPTPGAQRVASLPANVNQTTQNIHLFSSGPQIVGQCPRA